MSKLLFVASAIVLGATVGAPMIRAAAADGRAQQALTLTKQGKYAEAVILYEAMLKAKPTDRYALGRLGPLLFLTAEYERARHWYRRTTQRLPGYAKGWYFYAYALRKLGQPEPALRAYGAYRRLAPKDPHALYGMAVCYQALGKAAEAVKTYDAFVQQATQGAPKAAPGAWVLRARTEAAGLRKKLALARSDAAVREVLATARKAVRDGQLLEAEKILKAGWQKLGEPVLVGSELAGLLIRVRRFAEALPVLKVVLKKQPKGFDARYRLALALRYTGDLKGAAEAYRAVLMEKKDHPDTHYGLAETLRQLGKLKAALALYERYVVIEQRPLEQQWVTKAREQIAALKKQLAAAQPAVRPVAAGPARPGPGGEDPALAGITDPRIRALLEARRRFRQRQLGQDVNSPAGTAPAPDRRPLGLSPADRRRQRAEEARRRREAQRQRTLEAARRRKEEQARKREERRQRTLEAKRQREEAARRRKEELARKREAARAKAARAKAERTAKGLLAGRRGEVTPEIKAVLTEWAGQAGEKGDHAKAFRIWKLLAAEQPTDAALGRKLAAAATAAGDHRAAALAWRGLIKANPKDLALYAKARAAEAKAGLPLTPLPLSVVLPAEVIEGRRLLAAGQSAQALQLARRRLKAAPGDGYAAVLEADALFAQRLFAQARAAAERAAQAHPKLAGPHRVVAGYHLRLRDRSAALAQYRLFLKKLPGDPTEETHRVFVTAIVGRLSR